MWYRGVSLAKYSISATLYLSETYLVWFAIPFTGYALMGIEPMTFDMAGENKKHITRLMHQESYSILILEALRCPYSHNGYTSLCNVQISSFNLLTD